MTVSATVALIAARVASVPGWEAQRWVARACVTMAIYAALNLPSAVSATGPFGALVPLTPAAYRLQLALASVNLWIWMRYGDVYVGAPRGRAGRLAGAAALAVAALWLIPGAGVVSATVDRVQFGHVIHDAVLGPAADALTAVMLACHTFIVVRFVRAWRAGVPAAGAHAVAFGTLLAAGLHDSLAWRLGLPTPYLVDIGASLPAVVIGVLMVLRLLREAAVAQDLRRTLEARIEDGVQDLARSREALHRAERLAAVGELAAGVAHEVNNPASAAQANLAYLLGQLDERGRLPPDAADALRDAHSSVERIRDVVRRLTGAGRLATTTSHARPVELGALVRESLRLARVRCPDHVQLEQAPGDAAASTDEGLVVQVLVNLVVNGAQAIPRSRVGRVRVTAGRHGDLAILSVEDDGEGMTPEVLARAFEPFFTTKPFGVGTGLGLSISRGLLAAVGGTLRLESEPGRGTRAIVELPAAAGAADSSAASAT